MVLAFAMLILKWYSYHTLFYIYILFERCAKLWSGSNQLHLCEIFATWKVLFKNPDIVLREDILATPGLNHWKIYLKNSILFIFFFKFRKIIHQKHTDTFLFIQNCLKIFRIWCYFRYHKRRWTKGIKDTISKSFLM